MTQQEQLQKEMTRGVFITIEAPDKGIASKVLTVLDTALKYEFKDRKFVVVDPATCTPIAVACRQSLFKYELYGATYLLTAAMMVSEAVNIIRSNLDEGNNVICTSYLSDMVIELMRYYDPMIVANIINNAELAVMKNAEIIMMSPVPSDKYNMHRLKMYNDFVTAAVEDNSKEGNMTITYRIDTKIEETDDAIAQVIQIIGSTLARQDSLKDFAEKLFAPEPEVTEPSTEEVASDDASEESEPTEETDLTAHTEE